MGFPGRGGRARFTSENERKRTAMWSSGICDYTVENNTGDAETMVKRVSRKCLNMYKGAVLWLYLHKTCASVSVGSSLRWWRGIFLGLSFTLATIRLQRFLQEHATSASRRPKRAKIIWVHRHTDTHTHITISNSTSISRMTSTNAVNNRGDFPALLSQRGVSIINGNWLINRPGIYAALGTYLTYRRPNEIRSRNGESITAPGPLTEDLHVYVRWKMKNTDLTKLPIKIKNNLSFIMRYEVIKVQI